MFSQFLGEVGLPCIMVFCLLRVKALEVKNNLEPSQVVLLLALAYGALLLLGALPLNTEFSQGTGVEVMPSHRTSKWSLAS